MILKVLKNFWPQIIIFLAIILFLREVLFFGKMFVTPEHGLGDYTLGAVPIANYWAERLKAGELPLWAPGFFSGFPLAADGEPGLFYPLNLILFYFLPLPAALALYAFLTFLMMGFFTFYFLKNLNLSKEAALTGSLSFTFASGILVRLVHLPVLATIALFPLTLLLVEKFFARRNPLYLLLTSLVLSFQILNFNPPTTLICFTGFSLYFLFKTFTTVNQNKKLLARLFSFFLLFLLAGALSAILLVPGLKVLTLSERSGGIDETQAKNFAFHPQELLYFLRPTPFGDPGLGTYHPTFPGQFAFIWENNAYIGLLGLALGIFALLQLLTRPKKAPVFFGFLFLFSVFLALSQVTTLFFLFRLPPFSFFRVPGRFLILAMFSLATLAAFGFENITQKFSHRRPLLGLLAIGFILLDLFSFGLFYNPTYDAQKWLSPPQTAQFLKTDPTFFRIFSFGEYEAFYAVHQPGFGWRQDIRPYFNLREGLPPDSSLLYGLNEAEGERLGLTPQRSANWERQLLGNIPISTQLGKMEPNKVALKMLRLKNVKYLITPFQTEVEDFSLKKKVDFDTGQASFYLYELKNPLPHTFLIHQVRIFEAEDRVLEAILAEDFEPQKEVLLEEPVENPATNESIPAGEAEVVSYLPEKVTVRVKTQSPAFLILTDTNFPGWEAKVDGVPTKIYQANYLFRAVRVKPGEHRVEFKYKPKGLYLGAIISLTTFALMILFALFWLFKNYFSRTRLR